MLRRLKQLYGNKLTATDGEIGVVKDLYFDERNWTVRYVVAETGTWLTSRQVLLSPHAFADGQRSEKKLSVNLSRQQIAGSPALEWHQPVSRQFEEAYHRYYGWPNYWEDDCLKNFPGLETIGQAPKVAPKKTLPTGSPREMTGAHLRSTQTMKRYQLQAGGGIIGQVGDFLMENLVAAPERDLDRLPGGPKLRDAEHEHRVNARLRRGHVAERSFALLEPGLDAIGIRLVDRDLGLGRRRGVGGCL